MVQLAGLSQPVKDEPEAVLSQTNFARGVITLVDQTKIPPNALVRADNLWLAEDGAPTFRPGSNWYGTAPSAYSLDGSEMFLDSSGNTHLIAVAHGVVWRSLNDGATWTQCTGATLTAGAKCSMIQANGFLYIVNGVDSMALYNGTTTLQVYTAITTPASITTAKTGLAGTQVYTLYYRWVAVNAVGFTAASASASGAITTDRPRAQFDASNYITTTCGVVTGALRYDLYVGDVIGNEVYLDSIAPASGQTPTYVDKGTVPVQNNLLAPNNNTTTGPVVSIIKYVGDRLWATGDKNNPYRVWWTGAGPFIGYFSTSYDGGYIDLNVGSQFHPVDVEDYRDGKGTPLTTVFCKSANGLGCVWQIGLQTQTIENIFSFTVPSSYKIPGSRGTPAPFSVVNVLNDFMYYNSQAVYNLGSRAQFLNLLSTDEASANIRPSVRQINQAASGGICSHFYYAKVYISVPYGNSTTNNAIIIWDTERRCWLPKAFTFGVERFFQYSDANGIVHLLCWKPGDSRLTEINESFRGDYGQAFPTYLLTGLMPVSKNRFDFMFVDEADIEFTNPTGVLNIQLLGIDRNTGYGTIDTAIMTNQSSSLSTGWSAFGWSTTGWSSPPATGTPLYSEASTKRWFPPAAELNAYQFAIATQAVDAGYTLRTCQIKGMLTNAGSPPEWLLNVTPTV